MTTSFRINGETTPQGGFLLDEPLKDFFATQIAGFVGAPTAVPRCPMAGFATVNPKSPFATTPNCPDSSAIGTVRVLLSSALGEDDGYGAVYNLEPAPGEAARFGFWIASHPVTISARVGEAPPYSVIAGPTNTSQLVEAVGGEFTLWGVPADPAHDSLRGLCIRETDGASLGQCPVAVAEVPFLTVPRACSGPLPSRYESDSWEHPGAYLPNGRPDLSDPNWVSGEALTHDASGNPQGFFGCGTLSFNPEITAQPTSKAAQSPTGLDFGLHVTDEGLVNPDGTAGADIRKTVVTLPEGMTINPSQAEGLEVCSEAQLAGETSQSAPGEGCPQAAKIGAVEVETPLLEGKLLKGALYVAEPHKNPFNSLLAFYIVLKNRELGISVKIPAKVTPDPRTGQLVTTAEDLPELPFSDFRLHFKEGARSPLVSPPSCGTHTVEALLYPTSGNPPLTTTSSFQIISGPNNGPCPPPGTPPFEPGFSAGTLNNSAASYSPFAMRLQRRDGDQDLVRFDSVLPPGVVAKLAGVSQCSDAQIAQIKAKTGLQERANPSCPANSRIGGVIAGAGVGSQLTYVPGSVYLAGPFAGAPLSVVGVVPAVAGPFDVGVVSTRQALTLDPVTAEVKVDGTRSEPIPHILAGIPLVVRDIRVNVDRPQFTLNPTNCNPMAVAASIWGGGLDPFSLLDDAPVARSARFQAADCASLGFEPKLGIKLRGGTRRGAHPALRAHVRPRPGDANFSRAVVTLPRSAFLDQGHIRTICTRVQFAAGGGNGALCPPGAQYGFARAWSPLLDGPLSGPVFLRSSDNNLPDLVVALKGPPSAAIDIELSARIDSVKGGIRSTFSGIPDAPVSRFILDMQGGKKGLIVNSRNLCVKPKRNRAKANLRGQNGKFSKTRPVVRAQCKKKGKKAKRSSHRRARVARASGRAQASPGSLRG